MSAAAPCHPAAGLAIPERGSVVRGESLKLPPMLASRSSCAACMSRFRIPEAKHKPAFEMELVAAVSRFGASRGAGGGKPVARVPAQRSLRQNGTYRKHADVTKVCEQRLITVACYLCNTHPKTAGVGPFEAVPLLRVQKCSVIVTMRRRGASRGRPVRWFA